MFDRDCAILINGSIEVRRDRGLGSSIGSRNRSLAREIVSPGISGARVSRVSSSKRRGAGVGNVDLVGSRLREVTGEFVEARRGRGLGSSIGS